MSVMGFHKQVLIGGGWVGVVSSIHFFGGLLVRICSVQSP